MIEHTAFPKDKTTGKCCDTVTFTAETPDDLNAQVMKWYAGRPNLIEDGVHIVDEK